MACTARLPPRAAAWKSACRPACWSSSISPAWRLATRNFSTCRQRRSNSRKADIYAYAADPKFANTPLDGMLSKGLRTRPRRPDLDRVMAAPFPAVTDFRPVSIQARQYRHRQRTLCRTMTARYSDTTSLTVVDGDGLTIVMTTTLGGGFGSRRCCRKNGLPPE